MKRPASPGRSLFIIGSLVIVFGLPLVFNPFETLSFEPVKVRFFRWGVLITAVAGFIAFVIHCVRGTQWDTCIRSVHRQAIRRNPLMLPVIGYVAAYTLSALFSVNPRHSLLGRSDKHGILTLLTIFLFLLLLVGSVQKRSHAELIFATVLLGSGPICLYGFIQALHLDPLQWATDSVSPVLSTLGRSNFLGAYIAVVFPITLYKMVPGSSRRSSAHVPLPWRSTVSTPIGSIDWGVGMIAVMQVVCLLLTQARAGWLAFIGGTSVFVALAIVRRVGYRRTLLTVCGIWALGVLLFVWQSYYAIFTPDSSAAAQPAADEFATHRATSVERRFIIWSHTVPLISERWMLGYGPETFQEVFNGAYPPGSLYAGTDVLVDDPHNIFLNVTMSAGLLGLVAFVVLIVTAATLLITAYLQSPSQQFRRFVAALAGSGSAFLIQAQFNPDVIVLTVYFWLTLALVVYAHRWNRLYGKDRLTT